MCIRDRSKRGIKVEPDFMIESVDQEAKVIRSYDERVLALNQRGHDVQSCLLYTSRCV